jgi:hypothetical protein
MVTPDPATAAWLSECWKPVRELPLGERLAKRKEDRREQRELEERRIHIYPEDVHSFVDGMCTGNPESGVA